MSWFTIDSLYDYLISDPMTRFAINDFIDEYEQQILKFEGILDLPEKYDIIVHIASIVLALGMEKYSSKDFSWLRASVYYFAIYAYITAYLVNKTVKDVADLLQQLIAHAKSKRI